MCKVQDFDQFFVNEYDYLMGFAKSISPKSDYESLLHDCYCKIKDRITINGYSGSSFLNFTRVTIINQFKSNYRLQQKRPQVEYDNEGYRFAIESTLQTEQQQIEQEQERQNQISYINTMIFQYLDEFYDEKHNFIFKTYFLLKPKKLNYRTLSEATGYSTTTVSNVIKKMKKDLRENLKSYIYGTFSGSTIGNREIL